MRSLLPVCHLAGARMFFNACVSIQAAPFDGPIERRHLFYFGLLLPGDVSARGCTVTPPSICICEPIHIAQIVGQQEGRDRHGPGFQLFRRGLGKSAYKLSIYQSISCAASACIEARVKGRSLCGTNDAHGSSLYSEME